MRTEGKILTVLLEGGGDTHTFDATMLADLWQAARRFGEDDGLDVLVIEGQGGYFTSGFSVGQDELRPLYTELHLLCDAIAMQPKASIAVVGGPCFGAGIELVLSCDFRFGSPQTLFGVPADAMRQLAESGATKRFAETIGPHWTKWLAMAGEIVPAQKAIGMSLLNEVVEASELGAYVRAFAETLADR
jgi:enoyl-CoA hydratase/carnithine racemase